MAARPTQYQKLSLQLDAENKKLKAKLAGTKRDMGGLGKAAVNLGGLLAGAFAVGKMVEFGKEASRMAAQFEGVSAAFKKLGGGDVLEGLRESTKGTVADLELMKRAVQAKNFDIPMKDLAKLFEFATKRAQQTGESVDFLTNSIVLGIGRKSPLILDNLGISAIRLRKELKGVGSEAASVGDVAEAVGRIAQLEMEKAGDIIETTAIKTAQWGATWDNLTVSVGSFVNKGLNLIAPAINKIIPVIEKLSKGLFGDAEKNKIEEFAKGFKTLTSKEQAKEIKKTADRVAFLKKEIDKLTGSLDVLKQQKGGMKQYVMATDAVTKYKEELSFVSGLLDEITKKPTIDPAPPPDAEKVNMKVMKNIVHDDFAILESEWDKQMQDFTPFNFSEFRLQAEEFAEGMTPISDKIVEMKDDFNTMIVEWVDGLKGEVMEGWTSMAQIIGNVANGISNARNNWAALGATILTGISQMVPKIQAVIKATKVLAAAKKSEAVAGAIASSQTVPFPGNLVAMATSVGAVLATIAPFVGSFATGIDFVPKTGLAMIHRGEKITPAASNVGGGGDVGSFIRGEDIYFAYNEFARRRGNSLG